MILELVWFALGVGMFPIPLTGYSAKRKTNFQTTRNYTRSDAPYAVHMDLLSSRLKMRSKHGRTGVSDGTDNVILALRKGHREKAKGELQAMLYTYFVSDGEGDEWEAVNELIQQFTMELDRLTDY